jgi:uncharacterized protein (TIRG00374 family)
VIGTPGKPTLAIVGIAISIAAILWLGQRYDLGGVIAALRTARLEPLVPVPLLMVIGFSLRVQRWRLLLAAKAPVRFGNAFRAVMIGYLFNNLMPARAGELVRAHILGRSEGISRTLAFATIVVEKAGELVFMLGLLSLVSLLYPALPGWFKHAGLLLGAITIFMGTVFVVVHLRGIAFLAALSNLMSRVLSPHRVQRFQTISSAFLRGLSGLFDGLRMLAFFSVTAIIWTIEVLILHFVALAFGHTIPLGNLLFVFLAIAVGTIVPSAPGFVGTYEFFGVSALSVIGVTGPSALGFVIGVHAITLLGSSALGMLCLWYGRKAFGPGMIGFKKK